MSTTTMGAVLMLLLSATAQVCGIALLPMTKGYMHVGYTAAALGFFFLGTFLMARLIVSGTYLSFLMPAIGALIPLMSVVIGIVWYGEAMSAGRLATLVLACVLIGVSGLL